MYRTQQTWSVGTYTFYQVKMKHNDEVLFTYSIGDDKISSELYPTLDYALAAAVAERHTGRRGAGGTAVGTAADWFMRMIGADVQ